MSDFKVETKCLHSGYTPSKGEPCALPIYQSTTYKYDTTDEMGQLFDLKAEGIQVFTIKADLHDVGLTTAKTPFGHTVPVYDMERTICDLLRSRSRIEIQTFQGALKAYARRKDKNLRALMQYAGMFKVEKILRQYLEVLL